MDWKLWLVTKDYKHLLPWLGTAPKYLAYPITYCRAATQIALGGDWRQFLEGNLPKERRKTAIREINKTATFLQLFRYYFEWCLEELASSQLIHNHIPPLEIQGSPNDEPTIFLLCHFGISIPAAIFAEKLAIPSYALASSVIEHPALPRAVTLFYRKKYAALERHFHYGKVIFYEKGLKKVFEALEIPANLFVVTDLPPQPGQASIEVPLFGKKRLWSAGAIKMAISYRRPVQPYYAICRKGKWQITFGPVIAGTEISSFAPAYRFLAEAIEENPSLWWAIDLLSTQPVVG